MSQLRYSAGQASNDPQRTTNRRQEQLRRWGGYAFWLALASAVPLATDRLVIAPRVNALLGEDLFGAFVFVQAFFFIAGNIVANGLSLVVLRDYASQSPDDAPRMFRTSIALAAIAALVLLPLTAGLAIWIAPSGVRTQAAPLFSCLPLVAAFRSLDLMLVNMLRINRYFSRIVALKVIESAILLLCLRTLPNLNLWIVSGVYLLSAAATFSVNVHFHRQLLVGGGWWDSHFVRLLLTGSLAGALMTLFDQTQVHLSKLVLGLTVDTSAVAVFYAAISIGSLFVLPVSLLGTCLLSLFAGQREFALSGRRFSVFVACGLMTAVAISVCSYFLGPHIVQQLFPDLAGRVIEFFGWIALAGAGASLVMLLRPVVVKYGKLSTATWLSAVSVAVQAGLLPWAAARFGIQGAAVIMAAAALLNACMWLTAAFFIARSCEISRSENEIEVSKRDAENETIVFVQRVFSDYRAPFFYACGQAVGGLKVFHHKNQHLHKVKESKRGDIPTRQFSNWLPRLLEQRGVFFNPRLAFAAAQQRATLTVIEGESNLPINILLVPLLLLRGQPYAWFTLGRPTTQRITWRRRLLWPIVKWMLKHADRVACYSSAGKDYLVEKGIDPAKILVLNNAIDPETVLANEGENRRQASIWIDEQQWTDRLRVTYVGAMTSDKRPRLLLDVAARFYDATGKRLGVVFVGDGDELQPCRNRAEELGIDAQFVGRQQPAEAGKFILAGEVVVLPGLGGLAINHAMMLGRSVICGRADGTELDLVVDGRTGFYLDPLDEESLLETLMRFSADSSLAERLGHQARQHVGETASIDKMVQRLIGKSARHDDARRAA